MTEQYQRLQKYLDGVFNIFTEDKVRIRKSHFPVKEWKRQIKLEEMLLVLRNELTDEEHNRITHDLDVLRSYLNDIHSVHFAEQIHRGHSNSIKK